jgi:hypothetical protein
MEKACEAPGWFDINQSKMGNLPVFVNQAKLDKHGIAESITSVKVNAMVKFAGTESGLQPGVMSAYSFRKSAYEATSQEDKGMGERLLQHKAGGTTGQNYYADDCRAYNSNRLEEESELFSKRECATALSLVVRSPPTAPVAHDDPRVQKELLRLVGPRPERETEFKQGKALLNCKQNLKNNLEKVKERLKCKDMEALTETCQIVIDESKKVTTLYLRDESGERQVVHSVPNIPPVQHTTIVEYLQARVVATAAAGKAMSEKKKKPEVKNKKRRALDAQEEAEEEEFVVENVIGSRVSATGEAEYSIHWRGCDVEEATWEPVANLANAQDKISDSHARSADSSDHE